MKVGGFGEFESIRKAVQREEAKKPPFPGASARPASAERGDDAVQLSNTAKALGKLRQVPDIRQSEIDRVLKKMDDGSLAGQEVVRESVERLLGDLLSGQEPL